MSVAFLGSAVLMGLLTVPAEAGGGGPVQKGKVAPLTAAQQKAVDLRIQTLKKAAAEREQKLGAEIAALKASLSDRENALRQAQAQLEEAQGLRTKGEEDRTRELADLKDAHAKALAAKDEALKQLTAARERDVSELKRSHQDEVQRLQLSNDNRLRTLQTDSKRELEDALFRLRQQFADEENRRRNDEVAMHAREAARFLRRLASESEIVSEPKQLEESLRRHKGEIDEHLYYLPRGGSRDRLQEGLQAFTDALLIWRTAPARPIAQMMGTRDELGIILKRYKITLTPPSAEGTPNPTPVEAEDWARRILRAGRGLVSAIRG